MQSVTSNAVSRCLGFSTSERNEGGLWFDNSVVYKKTIPITVHNQNTYVDISDLSITMICNIQAIFHHGSWNNWLCQVPFVYDNNTRIGVTYDNGKLYVYITTPSSGASSNMFDGIVYVTLFYTKA